MNKLSLLVGGVALMNALTVGACSDDSGDDDASGGMAGNDASGGMAGNDASGGMAGSAGSSAAPPSCDEIAPLDSGDATFTASSSAFASCGAIPGEHTCDQNPFAAGSSPAVGWTAGPSTTKSYAVVFKDLSVLERTPSTDPLYNRGFHYVIWDIPATVNALPAAMSGGFASTSVPGARQWSPFNDYGFFGPCPNFDPGMPTDFEDVYTFVVYALPNETTPVPAPIAGISFPRQMDDLFKAQAVAIAEYRGTSNAKASMPPPGPPTSKPPCPAEGEQPADCVSAP